MNTMIGITNFLFIFMDKTSIQNQVTSVIGKIIIGFIAILYWNDGKYDPLKVAENVQKLDKNFNQNGQLIYYYGTVSSNDLIKDDYISPSNKYLVLNRDVEMYTWKEELDDDDYYTYSKEWTNDLKDSSDFKNSSYINPSMPIESESVSVNNAKIEDYRVKLNKIKLPRFKDLDLKPEMLNLPSYAQISQDGYIYIKYNKQIQENNFLQSNGNSAPTSSPTPSNFVSTISNPEIGDIRIRYFYVENLLKEVTIIGKLNKQDRLIESHFDTHGVKIYTMHRGIYDETINAIHQSFTFSKWLFRVCGFLMMFLSLMFIINPSL